MSGVDEEGEGTRKVSVGDAIFRDNVETAVAKEDAVVGVGVPETDWGREGSRGGVPKAKRGKGPIFFSFVAK